MSDTTRTTAADGRALVPYRASTPSAGLAMPGRKHILWAAALLAVFGIGAAGTHAVQVAWLHLGHDRTVAQVDPTEQTLRRLEEELGHLKGSVDTLRAAAETVRQDESLRSLKHAVEAMKTDIQQVRTADGSSLQQIAARLDKADRDPSPKLAEIVARLDRIEHKPAPQPEAEVPLARTLDPRQDHPPVAAGPAPAATLPPAVHGAANAAVTTVGRTVPSVAQKTDDPATKPVLPPTLGAWVVRDVYDGMALVQAREGGLREVEPGQYLPGAGRVRSIERRGRAWVVLTSRGVIENSTF